MFDTIIEETKSVIGQIVLALAPVFEGISGFLTPLLLYLDGFVADLSHAVGISHWLGQVISTTMLGLAFFLGLLLLVRGGKSRETRAELSKLTKRPRRLGAFTAVLLIFGFGGWSVAAPLASATIALGVVSPEGNRKAVSHLEGGIVKSIHVAEGELVEEGKPLVTLENVRATAELAEMKKRRIYLIALHSRLEAIRRGLSTVEFPEDLIRSDVVGVERVLQTQNDLFESQLAAMKSRQDIYNQRILQLKAQNKGLAEVTEAIDLQLKLLDEDIGNVQTLLDKGLAQAPRLLELKREHATVLAERARNRATIAQNLTIIVETEIELLAYMEELVSSASEELTVVEAQIAELDAQIPQRNDVLKRTVIHAPVSGTVLNVRSAIEFGVIRSGETIMEIVPEGAPLVIDARVHPNDIDRVHPGMETRVILSAYKQRNLPMIYGRLRTISADSLVEDRTGEAYYLAKIEVNSDEIEGIEDVEMVPGMPAEIMILNGEQTLGSYLLDPILGSLRRGLKES